MPSTAEGTRITTAFRRSQLAVRARMLREVVRLWPLLDLRRLDATGGEWLRLMVALVLSFRAQSAREASSFYEQVRAAELPGAEPYRALWAQSAVTDVDPIRTSLLVTGPVMIKRATANALRTPPETSGPVDLDRLLRAESATALERVSGAATRHVLDGARETLRQEGARDGRAVAFTRMSDGDPCYFCALMISRGAVYRSQDSAGRAANDRFDGDGIYKFHDHCGCTVVPVFDLDTPPSAQETKYQALYEQAKTNSSESRKPVLDEFRWLVEGRTRPAGRDGA